jgi:signal transduction histidine kinase
MAGARHLGAAPLGRFASLTQAPGSPRRRAMAARGQLPLAHTLTRIPHGEGIGLAIVKHLCQLLEASVDLESHHTGTTFRVSLPRKYS